MSMTPLIDAERCTHFFRISGTCSGDLGLLFSFTGAESASNSQGQYRKAATVKVISKELENVRTEQYHCHGLNIVMNNWDFSQQGNSCEIMLEMKKHTANHDTLLSAP
jgi:hypothetical protein